jgi:hypothetical protein
MINAIYLLQLGFRLVAVVGKLLQFKQKRYSKIHKEKQYATQYKNTEYTK